MKSLPYWILLGCIAAASTQECEIPLEPTVQSSSIDELYRMPCDVTTVFTRRDCVDRLPAAAEFRSHVQQHAIAESTQVVFEVTQAPIHNVIWVADSAVGPRLWLLTIQRDESVFRDYAISYDSYEDIVAQSKQLVDIRTQKDLADAESWRYRASLCEQGDCRSFFILGPIASGKETFAGLMERAVLRAQLRHGER